MSGIDAKTCEKQLHSEELTARMMEKFSFIPHESIEEMIKKREESIQFKYSTQLRLIHRLHEKDRISPTSFATKQVDLKRSADREREKLCNARMEIERGWR